MELREALIMQAPSLALQRAAGDEIARLDGKIRDLTARYYEAMAVQAEMHRRLQATGAIVRESLEAYNAVQDGGVTPGSVEFYDMCSRIERIHLALEGEGLTCETVPA